MIASITYTSFIENGNEKIEYAINERNGIFGQSYTSTSKTNDSIQTHFLHDTNDLPHGICLDIWR